MNQQTVIHHDNLMKKCTFSYGNVYFAGYFLYQSKRYQWDNLHEILADNPHFFIDHIKEIIGEFAIVITTEEEVIAIVDRKRSIPLFYTSENGEWIVTDKISKQPHQPLNETAVKEFIISGYSANNKTLYQNYFQVEAGTYVRISNSKEPSTIRYYWFYHEPIEMEVEDYSKELKETILQVFSDFAKSLKSKTPIIPLSGGYDSRIIAILLKEFDVGPLQSFTYGKQNNKEALVSKEIAQRLGIDWHFIEYKKDDWSQLYQSEEWHQYVDYAVNASTIAHLQDWPAVKKMIGERDEPFIFIPGHSGDFIAGSHLPYEITVDREFSKQDIVQFIIGKHHKLWKMGKGISHSGIDVLSEIESSFEQLPFSTNEQASALFEYWDWKERQAKFIINSVRVYEFFDKEWAIPLWDDRLMEVFKKVPVKYRYKQYVYDYTLNKMYPDYFPVPAKPEQQPTSLKNKYGALYPLLKKVYNQKRLYQQYFKEPMEWYGIYPTYPKYLKELTFQHHHVTYKEPYNINSFLTKDYILHLNGR